jgi:hypothetical protein
MGVMIALLVAMILAVLPFWPHSRNWGYFLPGSAASVLMLVLVVMKSGAQ